MTIDPVAHTLSSVLDALRRRTRRERTPGDLVGNASLWLAVRCGTPVASSEWKLPEGLTPDSSRLTEAPYLAAIGYLVDLGLVSIPTALVEAATRVAKRAAHTAERTGYADDPLVLAGLYLLVGRLGLLMPAIRQEAVVAVGAPNASLSMSVLFCFIDGTLRTHCRPFVPRDAIDLAAAVVAATDVAVAQQLLVTLDADERAGRLLSAACAGELDPRSDLDCAFASIGLALAIARSTQSPSQSSIAVRAAGDAPVDVAIVTILDEEYGAVHRLLRAPTLWQGTAQVPNRYGWELGSIECADGAGSYRVVLALTGRAGNVAASQATIETVERWRPRYVVLVGIAGGFAVGGCMLGDVVVSSIIYGYEYGKLEAGFQPRPHFVYRPDPPLFTSATRFAVVTPSWGVALGGIRPPKMITGVVASGEKVVDDPSNKFFAAVQAAFPKLQAVEMEGAGAASAIEHLHGDRTVGFIMVRGISDMPKAAEAGAQGAERDIHKARACEAAALFTTRWIAEAWPVAPLSSMSASALHAPRPPT